MTTALTRQQQSDLRACEQVIGRGIMEFRKVGQALAKVRDDKLYRGEYKTFEAYCNTRWGFGKSHAYRLIEAANVPETSPTGDKIETERDARRVLDQQKADSKPVAELDFDDDKRPGADHSRALPSDSADADRAGAPEQPVDRIALAIELQAEAYAKYTARLGDDAAWSCWLAGQESFNIQHETN